MCTTKKMLIKISLIMILIITAFLVRNSLSQESFPNRPITVVVPFGPGMSDTIGRIICRIAEKELGQPIIVENKPGAGGLIGANYVFKSKADGYTLGIPMTSVYIIFPHTRTVPYNPLTDAIDIATLYKYNFGLAVRSDAPWSTYEDVIAYARKNPGKFTYACAGVATTQDICMSRIGMKEEIKWTVVPFKSGAEAVAACLGGHTDAVVQGSIDEVPHIKGGKLKLLLTLDDKRWPEFRDVPNILEKGYNFFAFSWGVLSAPKGVPETIIKKLEDVFNKSKRDPSYIEALDKFKVEVGDLSGKEYSDLWRSKYDEMGKVLKALGLVEK